MVKAAYVFRPSCGQVDEGIEHLCLVDDILAKVIVKVGRFSMSREEDGLSSLVDAICSQQLSGKAAMAIAARLEKRLGGRVTVDGILGLGVEELRLVGLSGAKALYVRDLAKRVKTGELRLERLKDLCDEEVIGELVRVKGIGRWTAEMFLMFTLGRFDVLPLDDLGIRKSFNILYGRGGELTREEMGKVAERWKPYRTIASWYLWKALEG